MSIEIGKSALHISQLGLDTVGKNIAHANDPKYSRQRVHILNTVNGGVTARIQHAVNISLEHDSIRENAILRTLEIEDEIYKSIESNLNELSNSDLSSAFDSFYNSLEKLALNPHDEALRLSVVEASGKLTDIFHTVSTNFKNQYENLDLQVSDTADVINSLLTSIAEMNVEIAKREGGPEDSPASDLRDTRRGYLSELSELIDITTTELSNGTIYVNSGGRTMVFQGETRGVYVDRTSGKSVVRFSSNHDFVTPKNGKLAGYMKGRDTIIQSRMDDLNSIAQDFAWVINKVHNTGRGLDGVTSMTAETRVSANYIDTAIDVAEVEFFSLGNRFKPVNGVVTVEVRNDTTGAVEEKEIKINLVGDNKTTLKTFNSELNQVNNLTASIDNVGRLSINSDAGYSFFFKEDTSNITSFLGLNNFFTGSSAGDIGVNENVRNNVRLFSAGKTNDAGDNTNLQLMIASRQEKLSTGLTVLNTYEKYVASVATEANRVASLKDNQERILNDVLERRAQYSGVNLDEEAADLLKYQQAYQAAARYINIQSELIELLIQSV